LIRTDKKTAMKKSKRNNSVFIVSILEDNVFYGMLLKKIIQCYFAASGIARNCKVLIRHFATAGDFVAGMHEETDVTIMDCNLEKDISVLPLIEMIKFKTLGKCKVYLMSAENNNELKNNTEFFGVEDFLLKNETTPVTITGILTEILNTKRFAC
jgi:hypothetical protein